MNFDLKTLSHSGALSHKSDLLVVLQKTIAPKASSQKSSSTSVLSQYLSTLQKEEDFDAKPGKTLLILKPEHVAAKRLMILGVGEGKPAQIRKSVLSAFKGIKALGYREITLLLDDSVAPLEQALKLSVLAVSDALYLYTKTKPSAKVGKDGKSKVSGSTPTDLSITFATSDAKSVAIKTAFSQALALSEGIELAKEWGKVDPGADLLLLKSGWSRFRGEDIYSQHGPGLSPDVGVYLRKNYPRLRFFLKILIFKTMLDIEVIQVLNYSSGRS